MGRPARGRRAPVDPAELVVDRVLAQLVELGAGAPSLRRAQPHLEDPPPADAQLGLVLGAERRVDPEGAGQVQRRLAGAQAERPCDAHDQVTRGEPAPAGGPDGGCRLQGAPLRHPGPRPAGVGPQRRGELVGQRHPQRPPGGVPHRPGDLGGASQRDRRRQVTAHRQPAGSRRQGDVERRHREQAGVDDHEPPQHAAARHGEHHHRGEHGHQRQPPGRGDAPPAGGRGSRRRAGLGARPHGRHGVAGAASPRWRRSAGGGRIRGRFGQRAGRRRHRHRASPARPALATPPGPQRAGVTGAPGPRRGRRRAHRPPSCPPARARGAAGGDGARTA